MLFALQLLFNWLVVAGTVLRFHLSDEAEGVVEHASFIISVAFTILVSLDGTLNPKARWRQLRSSSCSLQSAIWLYRTRAGIFELDESRRDSNRPEATLCTTLTQWRDDLVAGASLKTTNLLREYPASVYRHYQDRGAPPGPLSDDFHSPTQPTNYIKLRIEPMAAFYAQRIPKYTRQAMLLKTTILLCGVAASVLARYDMLTFVVAVTAASSVTTSWAEFGDASRKVERYSSAVVALRSLLSWWDSLGEVQKASRESIAQLVQGAESIISQEPGHGAGCRRYVTGEHQIGLGRMMA